MKSLIVYRDDLLCSSETFILAQAEALSGFKPVYLGLRRRTGLQVPEDRQHVISSEGLSGKTQRLRFRLAGPSKELIRQLAELRPQLVHAHFGPDACNAMAFARALSIPLVVSLHGYDVTLADEHHVSSYVRRRKKLAETAVLFLCISEFIREQAIEKGFPPEKCVVHYTGVDTQFFTASPTLKRTPTVLFVGRLVAKKGCEYLIHAMRQVQENVPGTELVIIGDGPLRRQLEQQAAATLTNFRFLGVQEPGIVKRWMNCARVLCTPSVVAASGDAEGFGMVFAEAQSMGLPVVSFRTGGVPEAVADGQTGMLAPPGDPQTLARQIELLVTCESMWERFSAQGRERVKDLFNLRKQSALLEQLYESVLSGTDQTFASAAHA